MSSWRHFIRRFPSSRPEHFDLVVDATTARELELLAQRAGCSPQALAGELLQAAIEQRRQGEDTLQCWDRLSPREQQVAALICLNYTNRQAAARLGLSSETIKTHVSRILAKFELGRRTDLRRKLADWDFSGWGALQL